ncbi:MAG: DUF2752 domain-containing protein [Oscillospiraceae bacterium]|nr:DUF2752 domain-containing protein [Oscillospiraceae bacterium]
MSRGVLKGGILAFFLILRCLLGCPIYRWFGFTCPGCGLTRAWLLFLSGDWQGAFHQHFLFLLAPVFILLYTRRDTISGNMRIFADAALYFWGIIAFARCACHI